MILKIKVPPTGEGGTHWWMLDDLAKVHYHDAPIDFKLEKGDDCAVPLWDISLVSKDVSVDQKFFKGSVLIVRDRGEKETSIIFDTVAYLCNDNGETIEKIVGS